MGVSYSLRGFSRDHEIVYEQTCVSTPQQNGGAGRKYSNTLTMARALWFQFQLPSPFGREAYLL